MIQTRCFSCGHILAHLEVPFILGNEEIDNNVTLNAKQKAAEKRNLVNKLLPGRWKQRYCCRSHLITTVDLSKIII